MKRALIYPLADEDAKRFAGLCLNILAIGIACGALLFAWRSALFLRYAPGLKPYFGQTCIVTRDEDVLPAVLSLALSLLIALISSGAVLIYNPSARRITALLLIASLMFVTGIIAASAI